MAITNSRSCHLVSATHHRPSKLLWMTLFDLFFESLLLCFWMISLYTTHVCNHMPNTWSKFYRHCRRHNSCCPNLNASLPTRSYITAATSSLLGEWPLILTTFGPCSLGQPLQLHLPWEVFWVNGLLLAFYQELSRTGCSTYFSTSNRQLPLVRRSSNRFRSTEM